MEEYLVKENKLFKGYVLELNKDEILVNGKKAFREYVIHKGGVAVLVIEGEYTYLVKQYRYAIKDYVLEICAGKQEDNKTSYEIATQELREELGFKSHDLKELYDFYPSVGYTNELIKIYLSTKQDFVGQDLEENEYVEIIKLKLTEVYEMIDKNLIKDAKTVIAYTIYKNSCK